MQNRFRNYIGGEWLEGASWTANRNPSDLADVIGEYAQADARQTNAAVAAAKRAFAELVGRLDSGSRQHPRQGRLGHPGAKG